MVARFNLLRTITWLLDMVVWRQKNDNGKKYTSIAGRFDCNGNVPVQCGAHCPIEEGQGFPRSHWMPPLGKGLHCIALAAALAINFG